MRHRWLTGGTAPRLSSVYVWISLVLVVGAGCSRRPLPLAPKSPSHERTHSEGPAFVASDGSSEVVVTLAPGVEAAQVASDDDATLAGEPSWQVASFLAPAGESSS